jgi:transcriptional regulator with XRE-family HTH domain
MTYSTRLKESLQKSGKSRKLLATELGISVQAIGMILNEAGGVERKLMAVNNERAARFLGVDGYWLLTGDEPPKAISGVDHVNFSGLDALLELLPNDPLIRAQAFTACSQIILNYVSEYQAKQALQAQGQQQKLL